MSLHTLFSKPVISAGPDESLAGIARLMREHRIGTVVVTEARRAVGMVTDRDLAMALGAHGVSAHAPVRQVMTTPVVTIPADSSVFAASLCMRERKVRRLPIVDREDRVVGIVTLDDLLRLLGREFSNLAEGIRQTVAPR